MFRVVLVLRRLSRTLWFRVALFAALAIVAVVGAHLSARFVPDQFARLIGPEAVLPVLTIVASSMLAVSTFSLGIMVSAHRAAAQSATPRIMALLTADTSTQNVMAVFIGAFVYALTALILFHAGLVAGALVVLGITLAVVGAVVLALIRWIGHLTRLGTVDDALDRAEVVARKALAAHRAQSALGGQPLTEDTVVPANAETLFAPRSGHLQAIDVAGVAACSNGPVWILKRPGQTVLEGTALARVMPGTNHAAVAGCFVIGRSASFDQAPLFPLRILSEIASRALSPGINDAGTACDVLDRLERLLWGWGRHAIMPAECIHPTVFVRAVTASEMVETAFQATARDGAGVIEVVMRLRNALGALTGSPDDALSEAARAMLLRVNAYAEQALPVPDERATLLNMPQRPEQARPD
ncbi:MAG: DUF2254 domain-containing protein [Paracoccaceae bacterium]